MKIARFLMILLSVMAISVVASAQEPVSNEEFGVTVTPPTGWEVSISDEKAVASFKHADSQSQIQVIGTKLMNSEVADVFFSTFHRTLTESNFQQLSEANATYGSREGKEVRYSFTHSDVTLEVMVFEFLSNDTAWLVIGYMQDSERENRSGDFASVIETMSFDEG